MKETIIKEYSDGFVVLYRIDDEQHEKVVKTKSELKTLIEEIFA